MHQIATQCAPRVRQAEAATRRLGHFQWARQRNAVAPLVARWVHEDWTSAQEDGA